MDFTKNYTYYNKPCQYESQTVLVLSRIRRKRLKLIWPYQNQPCTNLASYRLVSNSPKLTQFYFNQSFTYSDLILINFRQFQTNLFLSRLTWRQGSSHEMETPFPMLEGDIVAIREPRLFSAIALRKLQYYIRLQTNAN